VRNDPRPLEIGPQFAPDRADMPTATRLKLDLRIHRQRLALRENWQIVESRQELRSTTSRSRHLDVALRLMDENRRLREEMDGLRARLKDTEAVERTVENALCDHFLGVQGDWERDAYGNVEEKLDQYGVVTCMTKLLATLADPEPGTTITQKDRS